MSSIYIDERFHPYFKPGFLDWLDDNEHVYYAFAEQAKKLIAAGRKHYSARTIVEVLVHHSITRAVGDEFKIGNDKAPDLARVFVTQYPHHANFWEYRRADWPWFIAELQKEDA